MNGCAARRRSRPARLSAGELDAPIPTSFEHHPHRLIADARAATVTALQLSPRRAHLRRVS